MNKSRGRNVYVPDDLWRRIQQAAIRQSAKVGKAVSPSAYIREAVEGRLKLTEPKQETP